MKPKFDRDFWERLWKIFLRSLIPAGPEMYDLVRSFQKSQTNFDQQVNDAVNALQNTSALISKLQQGVEDGTAKLQKLKEENERYSQLGQIEAAKAQALIKQVEVTLGKEQKKERWIAGAMHLGAGLIFFILGVLASDPFKAWFERSWTRLVH